MNPISSLSLSLLAFISILGITACSPVDNSKVVRIGHFPNITHLQALVARNMSRHNEGWFERYLPAGYSVQWHLFNGGPNAMEALFGSSIDLCYVGPSPAINAYSVSQGAEVRILDGAVKGGAALLSAEGTTIKSAKDLIGKNIATPQIGNTQDIACRAWLRRSGLKITLEGDGDARVSPTPNSMQAQLMQQGSIHASWTVEPWVSILEQKAKASIQFEQKDATTTILTVRRKWLEENPKLSREMKRAHRELTEWMRANPEESKKRIIEELSELTQSPIEQSIIDSAWKRLRLDTKIDLAELEQFVDDAQAAGLLEETPELKNILILPATSKEASNTSIIEQAELSR